MSKLNIKVGDNVYYHGYEFKTYGTVKNISRNCYGATLYLIEYKSKNFWGKYEFWADEIYVYLIDK